MLECGGGVGSGVNMGGVFGVWAEVWELFWGGER